MHYIIRLFTSVAVLYSFSALTLWPKSSGGKFVIVPYQISSGFNYTQWKTIREGFAQIEAASCIRFRLRSTQKNYVKYFFTPDLGDSEWVGVKGGMQMIHLSPFGSTHTNRVIHETLHTLGFHHMHQRFDRDEHVKILSENVLPNYLYALDKQNNQEEGQNTPYDFASLMHYPRATFSKNGLDTIVSLDASLLDTYGYAQNMSEGDILRLNRLYACPGFTKLT